jgi:D-alanyl-D-alanine carboxypeptidase
MTKRLKIFLFTFLISIPFWWGMNIFEANLKEVFFWNEIAKYPQIYSAQVGSVIKKTPELIESPGAEIPEIKAESAISVWVASDFKKQKVLFEKRSSQKKPIASLTKLMTAWVVFNYYDLEREVTISKEAVLQEGDFGQFKVGQKFLTKELLYPLLMESSNDAAYALSEVIGEDTFVDLMNFEADDLGLKNTHFVNSSGLPLEDSDSFNYSTCQDLVKFTVYSLQKKPALLDILSSGEYNLYTADKVFHQKIVNNNKLLTENSHVIGGKTGYTPNAGECLLLLLEAPQKSGFLINIILNSDDRFGEMKKLINWIDSNYHW